jgi:methylated-DNA-[protein]-cysteine S-methyltransferase
VTYAEMACRAGHPSAARAVGRALGRNPLPIVVPCHRVVGSDGRLTGYCGGQPVKGFLLAHEAAVRPVAGVGLHPRVGDQPV